MLVIWLLSIGIGEETFKLINSIYLSFLGRAVLIGITLSVCFNTLNDIRHLFWDYGYGFSLSTVKVTGWLIVLLSIVLTVLIWLFAYEVI